jgi:hypothetical protein
MNKYSARIISDLVYMIKNNMIQNVQLLLLYPLQQTQKEAR